MTNFERVSRGMELLYSGLMPYFAREMKAEQGEDWDVEAEQSLRENKDPGNWDVHKILIVMGNSWHDVFGKRLGFDEKNLVFELRNVRNRWAHQEKFNSSDAFRALDSMERLLNAISASEAREIGILRKDLMRLQVEEQSRYQVRKEGFEPMAGSPNSSLPCWRDVMTPHRDVSSGVYQQAEFAADLWQVYLKEGSQEYLSPQEFFRRTFMTHGLRDLLGSGLQRLAGQGGDPVVQLQTNFGGGKTHSMMALWHLFSGVPANELQDVNDLLSERSSIIAENANRAVFVGTKISPGQPEIKPDGTEVRTLWGELAWQLGGAEAFAMIAESDRTGTNPGDRLKELFNRYSPCLVLIDEWVAYARQLHHDLNLPAGTFDTQFTFAQSLSESAKAADRCLLVVSIPASDNEIGGELGLDAVNRMQNAIGRVESSWRPASPDEGFEIVRRRLFEPIDPAKISTRDVVCRGFSDYYRSQSQEFPKSCSEGEYERRLKLAYPIHPELFDRLFEDWGSLDRFQRTRGVLRLMAGVIHTLWERQDSNLMIMPSSLPIDQHSVQSELTRYLEPVWETVIGSDVDGPQSLPLKVDRDNPNLGRFSAARRVARTIYIGSAPTLGRDNKGLDDRQIKLGCAQPGETVAPFSDALRRLSERATFLYTEDNRSWYSTERNLNRLAADLAENYDDYDVREEVLAVVRELVADRGGFERVHVGVESSDLIDERTCRLVVLSPQLSHVSQATQSKALDESQNLLNQRGSSPRIYRNMLIFLAADQTRYTDLDRAMRLEMAWRSITNEHLDSDSKRRQAKQQHESARTTVLSRIPETYCWMIVPTQESPDADETMNPIRLQSSSGLAQRAFQRLEREGQITSQWAGAVLRLEMDKIPLWRGESEVEIRVLLDDFACYLYLTRVVNEQVIIDAIVQGINNSRWDLETFAYADGVDPQEERYIGLRTSGGQILPTGFLVQTDAAKKQIEKDQEEIRDPDPYPKDPDRPSEKDREEEEEPVPPRPTPPGLPKRFFGTVKLDPSRAGLKFSEISEEVLQHFAVRSDVKLQISIEIEAESEEGFDEQIQRTVRENATQLQFDSRDFEED